MGLTVLSMQVRHVITRARTKFIWRARAVAMKVTQDDDSKHALRLQNRHHHRHHDDSVDRRDDDDDDDEDDDDDGDDPNHHKRDKRCNRPLTLAGYLMGSQPSNPALVLVPRTPPASSCPDATVCTSNREERVSLWA